MSTNKWIYIASSVLLMAAGCSKDDGASTEVEVPLTFTEARAKGMVDVKYNAELQKLRKIHASPAIKINNELEVKLAELEAAKRANEPKERIDALNKECESLKERAAKAEKAYAKKMMRIVREKMLEERASVKASK